MKNVFKFLLLSFVLIMLVSCSKVDLYQDLNEEDANEMLVLLSVNGIKAYKKKEVRQNEIFWGLQVNQEDISRARELLVSHNLPRRKELGLTGVYKEKGLIPTPDEQKARFLLAIKGEIINSLEKMPEVVDADVVLNVPIVDEFADESTKERLRPTASVVVRIKPTDTTSINEAKVQQFVANSVQGLNPRDVAVLISYIDSSSMKRQNFPNSLRPPVSSIGSEENVAPIFGATEEVMGIKVDSDSKKKLKIYVMFFLVILLVLALALIIVIFQANRLKRRFEAINRGRAGNRPELEGQVVYDGPPQLGSGEDEQ